MFDLSETFWKYYIMWAFFVLFVCVLGMFGVIGKWYGFARMIVQGVKQVEYQQVMDSVGNHSLEYEKQFLELDAKIEKRLSGATIMLTDNKRDDIWWYVRTGEKSGEHNTKYGYPVGETQRLKLYIRGIDYEAFENGGKGRYYIWSKIIK